MTNSGNISSSLNLQGTGLRVKVTMHLLHLGRFFFIAVDLKAFAIDEIFATRPGALFPVTSALGIFLDLHCGIGTRGAHLFQPANSLRPWYASHFEAKAEVV